MKERNSRFYCCFCGEAEWEREIVRKSCAWVVENWKCERQQGEWKLFFATEVEVCWVLNLYSFILIQQQKQWEKFFFFRSLIRNEREREEMNERNVLKRTGKTLKLRISLQKASNKLNFQLLWVFWCCSEFWAFPLRYGRVDSLRSSTETWKWWLFSDSDSSSATFYVIFPLQLQLKVSTLESSKSFTRRKLFN